MNSSDNLQRFLLAQEKDYARALAEIKNGRKQSHWMWYIFPQLRGLGLSQTSTFYGLQGAEEAQEYLNHPVLGTRLITICETLLQVPNSDAHQIFGSPDDIKLKSCLTLFASLPATNPIFTQVLNKFFKGAHDEKTLALLENAS